MDITGSLDHYLGLSENTKRAYKNTLNMLQDRINGDEPSDEEVRDFLRNFKLGTTLQRHKAALRNYFKYKGRRWIFDSKEFATVHKKLPRYLQVEEIDRLISAAKKDEERMFVKTLFMTGIRIRELMSLTKDSIEGDSIRFIGKRAKERVVPILNKSFMQELRRYASKCRGKLFPKKYYDYWLLLRRLCFDAGVEMISPHSMRHSRAVDLVNKGVSLGGVQAFLGHEQPGTTLIYLALTQRDLRRELEKAEGG